MKVRWVIIFIFYSLVSFSQTPGFKFGPRFGFGGSEFTKISNVNSHYVPAVQMGLMARKQFTNFFAVEICPTVSVYGARTYGTEQGGYDTLGRPLYYDYKDNFRIGVVEFPFLAKFSLPVRHFYVDAFAGPSISVSMFGTHSRKYEDDRYNFDHGFTGISIRELYDGCYAGVFGIGVEREMKKGCLGIDISLHHLFTPLGKIEGSKFYVESYTLGVSWMR
jgi:hypothetical protein